MKNHKGKGKVHPSPAAASYGDESSESVLRLLPAAIMALAVVLGDEDREVLAYLILRSMRSPAPESEADAPAAAHRPELRCGCFGCYTSYWSRWNGSPEREVIHQVIEAFEEHLSLAESEEKKSRKKKKKKEKQEEKAVVVVVDAREVVEVDARDVVVEVDAREEAAVVEGESSREDEDDEEVFGGGGEKRKGWADVTGVFNWRFWNSWSPGV